MLNIDTDVITYSAKVILQEKNYFSFGEQRQQFLEEILYIWQVDLDQFTVLKS